MSPKIQVFEASVPGGGAVWEVCGIYRRQSLPGGRHHPLGADLEALEAALLPVFSLPPDYP